MQLARFCLFASNTVQWIKPVNFWIRLRQSDGVVVKTGWYTRCRVIGPRVVSIKSGQNTPKHFPLIVTATVKGSTTRRCGLRTTIKYYIRQRHYGMNKTVKATSENLHPGYTRTQLPHHAASAPRLAPRNSLCRMKAPATTLKILYMAHNMRFSETFLNKANRTMRYVQRCTLTVSVY